MSKVLIGGALILIFWCGITSGFIAGRKTIDWDSELHSTKLKLGSEWLCTRDMSHTNPPDHTHSFTCAEWSWDPFRDDRLQAQRFERLLKVPRP